MGAEMPAQRWWRVAAACPHALPGDDWQADLARLLGQRPRRLGPFAESALYGALSCVAQLPEPRLASLALVRLTTRYGAQAGTLKAVDEARYGLPMPFSFLQSQLSQALASLLAALSWQGDASMLITASDADFVRLSLLGAPTGDVLLGWVDDLQLGEAAVNRWLWLTPCAAPDIARRGPPALLHELSRGYVGLELQGKVQGFQGE